MPELPFDDEHAPLYSLGQVAEMLQVRQAYLRRLDEHDVISPSRSSGGQRRYSRADIMTVRHVTDLADQGMTLIAIRRILELERELADARRQLQEAQGHLTNTPPPPQEDTERRDPPERPASHHTLPQASPTPSPDPLSRR
ncbi:MerR family transcriptional regulator [Nonomuraea sp. NPDC051191]|uniref:MerR family transcriptional regulator n=1 Tax=Nonomuraea sp. NPDC051191 TaxID=3364372 RepID=UPI0037B571A5